MKIRQILVAILLLFLASCASGKKVSDFHLYNNGHISKSAFMPSKEDLEGKNIKVAVFPLEENDNEIAKQSGLGTAMANDLENVLGKEHIAQIIDRKATEKLRKEVTLSEMKKTGSYKGPQVADYVISGTISNATFNGEYSPGGVTVGVSGQLQSVPPSSTFISSVSGNVKIYELPSLEVLHTIPFAIKRKVKENAQDQGGLNIMGLVKVGAKEVKIRDRDDGMVRRAGYEAVKDIGVDLKNALAKRGYVIGKRSYDGKSIFKINLGSEDGIKPGDQFEIIGRYDVSNQITGDSETESRIIAKGEITQHIDPETSWAIIDDEKIESAIRLGDSIKFKYERGLFAKLARKFNSF